MAAIRSHSQPIMDISPTTASKRGDFELIAAATRIGSALPARHPARSQPDYVLEMPDAGDIATLDRLRGDPQIKVEQVLIVALDECQGSPLADDDVQWGLRRDITQWPAMPAEIPTFDIDRAIAVYTAALQRDISQPHVHQRKPLMTSMSECARLIAVLETGGLFGFPIYSCYVGSYKVGWRAGDARLAVMNQHEPYAVTLANQPPWRRPRYIISGHATAGQSKEKEASIARALGVPSRKILEARGTHVVSKVMEQSNNGGHFVVAWQLDLAMLLQCLTVVSSDSAAFRQAYGNHIDMLDRIRPYTDTVRKYAALTAARTHAELDALVARGQITERECNKLGQLNIALEFIGTAHDGPAGTHPGYAHVVAHHSGDGYSSERFAEIRHVYVVDRADLGAPYQKPDGGSHGRTASSTRNTPVSSRTSTPVFTARNSVSSASASPTVSNRSLNDAHREKLRNLNEIHI